MKQITIKCPPGFELGSDVYIIPGLLGNKHIVKYKILDFHYSSLGCGTLLSIVKKAARVRKFNQIRFCKLLQNRLSDKRASGCSVGKIK